MKCRYLGPLCLLALLGFAPCSPGQATDPGESAVAGQQITNLDQLLQAVRDEQRRQREVNRKREQQFLQDKRRQQALLEEARRDFDRRQQENQPLIKVTENNAEEIARLEQQLQDVVEDMGDLSSAFREFSGDFAAVLQESMITVQLPQRADALRELANTRGQPSIEEIQALWLFLQEEMTEAGKVTLFEAPVVSADGSARARQVLRVGTFSAFADGDFLRYVPETSELLVLTRQPAARFRSAASEFASASSGLASITVDPTRGSLLGILGLLLGFRDDSIDLLFRQTTHLHQCIRFDNG